MRLMAARTQVRIPTVDEQATVDVDLVASALGISKLTAYRAIDQGEIPAIRLGRRLVVPTAALRRLLALDETQVSS